MHTQNQMDRSSWNVRVSYRSDPQQLKASARKRLILAIPLTVVTIGLVYVAVTVSALLWILVAISALGALIWWSLWYGECPADRKSTRLNSSHVKITYAVFCLKR